MAAGELEIELLPDGSIRTNARKMKGSSAEILDELNELAKAVGGELEVEKHEPGQHHHHHDHDRAHQKGRA